MLGLFLAWVLIVVAIARPQWVGEPIELPNTGRDLMLSLDLSGSMQIRDMQVGNRIISRVEAVKAIASDFTERRVGDRVGLILFGSKAYVQAPLTFDTTTVTQFIREAQLGFAGEDTAIGDSLGLAIKRLRDRPAASRVLILLTDGQDTAAASIPWRLRRWQRNKTSRCIPSVSAETWAPPARVAVKWMKPYFALSLRRRAVSISRS